MNNKDKKLVLVGGGQCGLIMAIEGMLKKIDKIIPDERQTRNRPHGWYRQFEKKNKRKGYNNE